MIFFASSFCAWAQAFSYSYVDPCTGKRNYVAINEPGGSITLSYNTNIKTFKIEDFSSGAFEAWVQEIKNKIPVNNPCGSIGLETTVETNTQISMNTVSVITNVITSVATSVSGASDVASSVGGVGSVQRSNSSGGEDGEDGDDSDVSEGDGNNSEDGESNNENDQQGDSKSDESGSDSKENEEGSGGGGSEAKAAGSSRQKVASVKKGNLIATGDVVGIQNATTGTAQQFRLNLSLTYSDSRKVFVYGGLGNFTTSINNSSITLFGSYRWKKLTNIIANSTMVNFERDVFNTTTILSSYPVWKIGTMLGINATYGILGNSGFQSYSTLAGLNGGIPFGSFNINLMVVALYSPYTFYYEGMWYKTNFLAVPFVGVDYALTKNFKFNVSFSGVYEVKNDVLNYQILIGGKYLF